MAKQTPRYPRFRTMLPVQVRGMTMTTSNLSLSGTQVTCPAMIYRLISAQLDTPPVPVVLTLDDNVLTVEARLVYVSDYDDEFLLGMSFDGFAGEAEQHLRDYLVARGGPSYVELETGG